MTTLTMRYMRGHFVVTSPDVEPVIFKSRREARDWCAEHHPAPHVKSPGVGPAGPRPPTHAFHRRQETSAPSARDPNLMVTASSSPNNFPRPPVTPLRPVHTPKAYP